MLKRKSKRYKKNRQKRKACVRLRKQKLKQSIRKKNERGKHKNFNQITNQDELLKTIRKFNLVNQH